MPSDPRQAVESFVKYYNHERYQQSLGIVTPTDVYHSRRDDIVARGKGAKCGTLQTRRGPQPETE